MSDSRSLRAAAKELVEVLGLVDKNKKDIVITKATPDKDVLKIIKDALPLIDPKQDEFSDETQEVIDELSEPAEEPEEDEKPVKKPVRKVIPAEEEEEEDEKPVKKGGKTPPKGVKPNFKKEGSMAEFIDNACKEGGTFEEIAAACKEEGESRGVNTKFSPSVIKAHVKFRLSKDAKFLGKLKMREDGIS
jgi:hypothetical protein